MKSLKNGFVRAARRREQIVQRHPWQIGRFAFGWRDALNEADRRLSKIIRSNLDSFSFTAVPGHPELVRVTYLEKSKTARGKSLTVIIPIKLVHTKKEAIFRSRHWWKYEPKPEQRRIHRNKYPKKRNG